MQLNIQLRKATYEQRNSETKLNDQFFLELGTSKEGNFSGAGYQKCQMKYFVRSGCYLVHIFVFWSTLLTIFVRNRVSSTEGKILEPVTK